MKTTTTTISGIKVTLANNNGSLEVGYMGRTIGLGEDAYGETAVREQVAKMVITACMAKSDENKRKVMKAIDRVMAY